MTRGSLFSGAGSYAEGQRLFEQGMKAATDFRSNEAIDYYTRSIEARANPSPFINRANLLMKRIRYREALSDLIEAKRLDDQQGREFTPRSTGRWHGQSFCYQIMTTASARN